MKTNKAVVTLLVVSALWLALVLGCSYLQKGTMSPSSSGGASSSGSKDYFPLSVEIPGNIDLPPRTANSLNSLSKF